ncbi:MAG: DUF4405 domain-containing protein [Candidatus Jettenia sp.]|uniref:Flavinylation-associated cytochrome domain-containing protein n=1 Tax=Candidatus Jettenia caeni TaxID=247490 RepID=I3IHV3_9BACT|nr:DUF4405 domain-containing protein [Candidatus Jettenia sp. AMX1]MBC6930015.1 DUF4405 domain-containing protein [Candidatus Jettenia sp.]WKZ16626.1 MAG: DUF4405 domain-containing protein [Candidatus Jettenia caeni]KAA0248342.1 MAG: DUF4405 domain-containing protein [Candidatus Jettenia sp. AMX1]MCE7881671.1 DUF4405 domain-containing protein [Candidatus Jettenia sp. AMX1]MCQ3928347.1 DUF4405 domain-containing protein [Candidatus Jettenia sp.]
MDKPKANIVIDTLMFLCMMAIVGIGMLIKFILLPGKKAAVVYGRKVDLLLFGLDRHAWGTIHLIVAFVFLGLLALHIIFHWKMIFVLYRRLSGNKVTRRIIVTLVVIVSVSLVVLPWIIKPEVQESSQKRRH